MGYVLCTCEKPSVAKDIATVLNATNRKNGYFEGNGYLVSWTIGHLVTLAPPELYDETLKKWDMNTLPMIPTNFKTVVISSVSDQYKVLKELFQRTDIDYIVDCGDAGREGVYIQTLVRNQAKCKKPVKRLWISSYTEESIKDGFKHLEPIEKYDLIYQSACCRAQADWLIGMNASRLFTLKYGLKLTVGRVQTPTLALIVQQFVEIKKFVSKDYFQLQATFKENFSALWFDGDSNHFSTNATASQMFQRLTGKSGKIISLETKEHAIERPQLFDLTELQRECIRKYGYSADDVLKVAQRLYEVHKITTYPRTDSRYLSSDIEKNLEPLVKKISSLPDYQKECTVLLQNGLNIDKRIINDSKVSDHHAIIVTDKIFNFNIHDLTEIEYNVLHMIIVRILASFSKKHIYDKTSLIISIDGENFNAVGRMTKQVGYKELEHFFFKSTPDTTDQDEQNQFFQFFQDLKLNQTLTIEKLSILSKKTTAPKLLTEDTLLTAMENAGRQIEEKELKDAINKSKGLGTPATRASIIKNLFENKYVEHTGKGKTKSIVPTQKGLKLISSLPRELVSAKLTAEWEFRLEKIAKGEETPDSFISEIKAYIHKIVQNNKEIDKNNIFENVSPTTAHEEIGNCPRCGSPVLENSKAYSCTNKSCSFYIYKEISFISLKTGKPILITQAKSLLKSGKFTAKCKSEKGEYNATFLLQDDGITTSFKMEFEHSNRK